MGEITLPCKTQKAQDTHLGAQRCKPSVLQVLRNPYISHVLLFFFFAKIRDYLQSRATQAICKEKCFYLKVVISVRFLLHPLTLIKKQELRHPCNCLFTYLLNHQPHIWIFQWCPVDQSYLNTKHTQKSTPLGLVEKVLLEQVNSLSTR